MVVNGSSHTVEPRSQINNLSDGSKQDGTSTIGFSSFLFLILSIPVLPNNAATSSNGQDTGSSQATLLGNIGAPLESMQSDGAADSGASGVQAENQQTAFNADLPTTTDSAQNAVGIVSDPSLTVESKPQSNGVPGNTLHSTSGGDKITNSREAGESPTITNFIASLALSDRPLAADLNAKQSDRPGGIFQPAMVDNEQSGPAQNLSPSIHSEQTGSIGEAAQVDVVMMKPSEVVDKPKGGAHLQDPQPGPDSKKPKLVVAWDPDPPAGKVSKASAAVSEEVRGQSEVQSGKENARGPMAADGNNLNDFGASGGNDHLQNQLESKEEQKLYSGSSASAKTSNGEFKSLISDKTLHEATETSCDVTQRSNETITLMARPTVPSASASAASDTPATAWRPVVERIAKEMVGRVKLNQQDAIIQLDPPELGKIKIDLHVDGDKLQARIFIEAHESQSLIEDHLQELRQALQANHLDLVDVRVQSWHGASGDAMHGFPQQHQQQTSGRQEWSWTSGDMADGDAAEAQLSRALAHDPGRVSMWA